MSFGASAGDIIIVVSLCRALYRKCRSAGGEYDEISREVRGLHTVLKHLKYEVEAPESILNRDQSIWGRQLAPIIGDCDFTLRQLDELLQKYGRLGGGNSPSSSPSSARVFWERIRFGSNELDNLGSIRVKLLSHKTTLTLFLETIQLHQSGKVSQKLDNHAGQLDSILDKVDNIVARMGQKTGGSVMTSYDDDDKEVWKQFRRELVAEGFSSDVLQQHKGVLRAYLREIDQNGPLDEPRTPTPSIMSSKQWVDSVHSASEEDSAMSQSMSPQTDCSTKEMMVREDNMKFPQSMKQELRRPESRRSEVRVSPPKLGELEESITLDDRPLPISIIIPGQATMSDEKEAVYQNTEGSSSNEELNSETGAVIRTSDLLALTRAVQLHVPGSPATSFRSSLGSIADDEVYRSTALRPKRQIDPRSSLSQLDGLSISNSTSRSFGNSLGTNPFPIGANKLAPDQNGREIPPDAQWTKIKRSVVSPEVLQQDGRRYEARPDFVAVLGILSRSEIEKLAIRSQALRASRQRRSMSVQPAKETPPPPPPRPIPVQPSISFDSASQTHSAREPSLSSSRSSSSSDSDSDYEHQRRRHQPHSNNSNEDCRTASSSLAIPIRGYPNAYGVPPPPLSSTGSSSSMAQQAMYMSGGPGPGDRAIGMGQSQSWNNNYQPHSEKEPRHNSFQHNSSRTVSWTPQPSPSSRNNQQYPVRGEREGERDRTRDRDGETDRERDYRRRHSSNENRHREYRDHSRYGNSNSQVPRHAKRTWKDNLASAGIGGAAATLLNVLTEAAESL